MKDTNIPFVVATKNADKLKEIRQILHEFPFHIMSMTEAGIDEDIDENGQTYAENALIKAMAVHTITGGYVMADDSGIEIDALGGAPGIFSARFVSKDASYPVKIQALWELLKDVPFDQRTAHFVCAIAVVCPDGSHFTVQESMDGILHNCIIGDNGFGYDPVFYLPEKGITAAQLSPHDKNLISHRGKALRSMLAQLRNTWYSIS
jgi:XTP/dITP diphosphohydrolase